MTNESNSRSNPTGSPILVIDGNSQKKKITSNETRLTIAVSDVIISEGLSLNIYQNKIFKKVLEFSRNVSKTYIRPDRKIISKELLDVIHEHNTKSNLAMIKKEAKICELLLLVDSATISRFPL